MKSNKWNLLILGILLWAVMCLPGYRDVVSYVWKAAGSPVVVVDPGHGGLDGGASSSDGICEKDLNLKIAKALKKQLEAEGVRVIMTREGDEGLYDGSQEGTIRSLKTRDMHARKQMIDASEAALAVSIHLNSFTQDPSVKGAQVFFPSCGDAELMEKSKQAAQIIQKDLNAKVNADKPRTEMGKDDVFLLKEITCPIVIVECGFLSNPDDAEKLKTRKYQLKISKSLRASICNYLKENGNKIQ